jgi:hypothetical protein
MEKLFLLPIGAIRSSLSNIAESGHLFFVWVKPCSSCFAYSVGLVPCASVSCSNFVSIERADVVGPPLSCSIRSVISGHAASPPVLRSKVSVS